MKIVFATCFVGHEICFVGPSVPEPKRLPYLIQGDAVLLFSSNAQATSLFPQQSTLVVDEWLEFESAVLAPTAALVLAGNSKLPEQKNKLVACLKVLDTAVTTVLDLNGVSYSSKGKIV